MKQQLVENGGFPSTLLYILALLAGVSVANIYYNQPLLVHMQAALHCTELQANNIALFTQTGYAAGLLFLIPLADLYSRKRLIVFNFCLLILSLLIIATSVRIYTVHCASFVIGACSVTPHFFVPLAAQYSRPEKKGRNVGVIVSGLLIGILSSRVISGYVGDLWGWRSMYYIAAGVMAVSTLVVGMILPSSALNFKGTYLQLMRSLFMLIRTYPALRINALRASLAFGSFLCMWASLAFHLAEAPFYAGSDKVGLLGLCGIAGALAASFVGSCVKQVGVRRFNYIGMTFHLFAWAVFALWGDRYIGLVVGIVLIDIGMQTIQLGNQTLLFELCPSAANRINTVFMTTFFLGGAVGTFFSGLAWSVAGWSGVVMAGVCLSLCSYGITCFTRS